MTLHGAVVPRRSRWFARLSALEPTLWLAAALAAAVAVYCFVVRERAPFLVWDEAQRVSEGAGLAYALRAGDLAGAWRWMHAQVIYPVLAAAPHGLALLVIPDPLIAAWVPSVVAYAIAGFLAGRLARSLGSSKVGAWLAAVLYWSTPLVGRLAGGAFTESMGACLYLLLLLGLMQMGAASRRWPAALSGAVVATAWLLKYDYGILATGVLGVHALAALASRRGRDGGAWRRYRLALYCALAPVLLWFCINPAWKVAGARSYIAQVPRPPLPGESVGPDFSYYLHTLFGGVGNELGLSPVISLLLLGSVIWGVWNWQRLPQLRTALVLLGLWYVMYSLPTNPKYPRYLASVLPVLTALAGVAASESWVTLRRRLLARAGSAVAQGCVALLGAALVCQVILLAAAPTSWRNQYQLLPPYTPVVEATAFVSQALGSDGTPVLLLGQTNEYSPHAVRLAWEEHLGRVIPPVLTLPEVPAQDRLPLFIGALQSGAIGHVVAVGVAPGSQLDSDDFRIHFPSQRDYPAIAEDLARRGILRPAGATSLDNGALRVAVYDVVPGILVGQT